MTKISAIRRKNKGALIIVAPVVAALLGIVLYSQGLTSSVTDASTLRALAQARNFKIGSSVIGEPLGNEPIYGETLKREFNIVTTENELKWDTVHPDQGLYNFEPADAIVNFALDNEMKVRGHTLVWEHQNPDWVVNGGFSRKEMTEILRDHIETIVGYYRGKVAFWDVINEPLNDDGTLKRNIWFQTVGPKYIELALTWAREADPDAKLFINEYGAEGVNSKSTGLYNLVKDFKQRGIPIDGVGAQMHLEINHLGKNPGPPDIVPNIRRFAALGVEYQITEMDVRLELPATQEDLIEQGRIYKTVLSACLGEPKCTALVTWGFTDKYSWIPYYFSGWGSALIFDEQYQPKLAYWEIQNALANASIQTPVPTAPIELDASAE